MHVDTAISRSKYDIFCARTKRLLSIMQTRPIRRQEYYRVSRRITNTNMLGLTSGGETLFENWEPESTVHRVHVSIVMFSEEFSQIYCFQQPPMTLQFTVDRDGNRIT